jgi:hypothetical protein
MNTKGAVQEGFEGAASGCYWAPLWSQSPVFRAHPRHNSRPPSIRLLAVAPATGKSRGRSDRRCGGESLRHD